MSQVPFMPPSCEWEPPDGKLQHLGVLKLSKPRQFKPHIPDHLPHSLQDDLCHGSEAFHHPPGLALPLFVLTSPPVASPSPLSPSSQTPHHLDLRRFLESIPVSSCPDSSFPASWHTAWETHGPVSRSTSHHPGPHSERSSRIGGADIVAP